MTPQEETQLRYIARIVCRVFLVEMEELIGKGRQQPLALIRQYFFYIARENTNVNYRNIGLFCDRDHATALHGYNKIKEWREIYPDVQENIHTITNFMVRQKCNDFSLSYLTLQKAYNLYMNL